MLTIQEWHYDHRIDQSGFDGVSDYLGQDLLNLDIPFNGSLFESSDQDELWMQTLTEQGSQALQSDIMFVPSPSAPFESSGSSQPVSQPSFTPLPLLPSPPVIEKTCSQSSNSGPLPNQMTPLIARCQHCGLVLSPHRLL